MVAYNAFIMKPDRPPELRVIFENRKPVELLDLTASLTALAEEFKTYIEQSHPEDSVADVSLYVHELRKGSIISDLIAYSPALLGYIGYANTIGDFVKHIKAGVDWLSGDAATNDALAPLSKQTTENIATLVEPVAKDGGSNITISNLAENASVVININSQQANAIQNRAQRHIRSFKELKHGLHEKVLMHWFQARKDGNTGVGDRAIIESISPKPVKTICATDSLKSAMVMSTANPFQEAFLVDVVVETVNEKPALFKVTRLHERFEP